MRVDLKISRTQCCGGYAVKKNGDEVVAYSYCATGEIARRNVQPRATGTTVTTAQTGIAGTKSAGLR